jgi:hypothetical protein
MKSVRNVRHVRERQTESQHSLAQAPKVRAKHIKARAKALSLTPLTGFTRCHRDYRYVSRPLASRSASRPRSRSTNSVHQPFEANRIGCP